MGLFDHRLHCFASVKIYSEYVVWIVLVRITLACKSSMICLCIWIGTVAALILFIGMWCLCRCMSRGLHLFPHFDPITC